MRAVFIFQFFKRLFISDRLQKNNADKLSDVYKELFKQCPVCNQGIDGHGYMKLASVIVDQTLAAARLEELIFQKQWNEAAQVTQWEYDKDIREYYAIRCPGNERLGLVSVIFTHEFWSKDFVEKAWMLFEEDTEMISIIAGNQWKVL